MNTQSSIITLPNNTALGAMVTKLPIILSCMIVAPIFIFTFFPNLQLLEIIAFS